MIKKTAMMVLGLAAFVHAMHAFADEQDTLNFVAGITSRYDSNLFRTINDEESEQITGVSAGVRLNKQYSLQRFTAEASIVKNQYKNNGFLDFVAKNFNVAWYWALTPRLTGTISADRAESLNNFFFTRSTVQNIRTSQNQAFLADFNPGGGWHALAGFSRQSIQNSQNFFQDASYSANAVDFGVKYVFPSQSSITQLNHIRKGKFDDRQIDPSNLLDDGFKEVESEVIVDWKLTAKSTVNLRTSYIKRENDNFSIRDYSGFQANLRYFWEPTAKITVALSLGSNLSAFQDNQNSYTRVNSINLSPRYAVTPKINITAGLTYQQQEFLGEGPDPQTGSNRLDKLKSANVGVNWTPTRNSTIGLNLSREELDSSLEDFGYKANSALLSGNILF